MSWAIRSSAAARSSFCDWRKWPGQEGYEVDVLTTDTLLQQVLADHGIGVIDIDVIWRRISPARDMGWIGPPVAVLAPQRL